MNQISRTGSYRIYVTRSADLTPPIVKWRSTSKATDAQVKQFFQKSAQSAVDCKNQLMQYLRGGAADE